MTNQVMCKQSCLDGQVVASAANHRKQASTKNELEPPRF
jgi:hypothetical protein